MRLPPGPEVTRLTAGIGAQLRGIDLRAGTDPALVRLLRTAVAEHHVVVLRDQFLSAEHLAGLAEAFGPILPSPIQIATGTPSAARCGVSTIEDTAERPPAGFPWHTDLSWTAEPPHYGFLSALTIPAYGGDTLWASTAAIFDALSSADQEACRRSTILHAPDETLLASVARHHGPAAADRLRREHPGHEHALVGRNRSTGREHVFLSPLYARRVDGPAAAHGSPLSRLNSMLDDPHLQLRWRWRVGDLAIWDETSTCHRALTDHHPQRRVMRRCVTGAS